MYNKEVQLEIQIEIVTWKMLGIEQVESYCNCYSG